jgi:hypothetical protein
VTHSVGASRSELHRIAAETYQYFYPLVLMDVTRRITGSVPAGVRPGFGPMNAWTHMRAFPPGDFKEVVRPNFDTLYSIAWFDLTEEPVIIGVPDSGGRYYMLPILDMWTDVVAVPGRRTSGTQAGHFALTGPGWTGELPAGVTPIRVPTPYAWCIGRTQTNGPKDYEAVHVFQDGRGLCLLSDWGGTPRPAEHAPDAGVDTTIAPVDQVNEMSAEEYFAYAARLMKLHPPHSSDGSIALRMRRLGLEPGAAFDADALDADTRAVLAEGAEAALEEMRAYAVTRSTPRDGWVVTTEGIGVYGNNYLHRAVVAMIGLGANPGEDAIYPLCVSDHDGNPLLGGERYAIHFDAGRLPPVGAFWSVTMYDAEGFTVPNDRDRYAIGDRDDLTYNGDGSLDLYLQSESPGPDKESNWLPSQPGGVLGVTMRQYEPGTVALSGAWSPPPVRKA